MPFDVVAADLLEGRRTEQIETWAPGSRRLTLFIPKAETTSANEPQAKAEALKRAQPGAERLCKSFAATISFRFVAASLEPQAWNCMVRDGGMVCGFEGEAMCSLEERRVQTTESCNG